MPTRAQLLDIIHFQSEMARLGLDLGEVMALAVNRTVEITRADGAAVELAEGRDMVYRATAGIASPFLGLHLGRNGSLSGLSVQTGENHYCPDIEQDPRVNQAACRKIGIRSMFVVPLKYHDRTVGILKAMSSKPNGLSGRDRRLLELMSEVIASSIHFAVEFGDRDLFYRATHDSLTDLANRSMFMDRLRNILSRCHREGSRAGLAIIDMDGLKPVNDCYGHRAGDAVIREFAARIRQASRESDTVARIGGDEFAVILTPFDTAEGTKGFEERLQKQLATPFFFEKREYALRASIGIAIYPNDANDIEQLLECADQRMYATKRARYARQPRSSEPQKPVRSAVDRNRPGGPT